jgi:hypothetical protein
MQNSLFTFFYYACRPNPIKKVSTSFRSSTLQLKLLFVSNNDASEEVWIGPTGLDEVCAPVSHL